MLASLASVDPEVLSLRAISVLQSTAGNAAVAEVLKRRRRSTQLDVTLQRLPWPMPIPAGIAAEVQAMVSEEVAREHKEIDPIIESLPDHVRDQIPYDDRLIFMHAMRGYLGPDPATQKHFQAIDKVQDKIPQAEIYLHRDAANQLNKVYEQVGGVFPYTDVGQEIRGRYHERKSKSLMAHPMGYAVDFRPRVNPQISNKELSRLLELVGESGPAHAELGLARGARRRLIAGLAAGTLSSEDEAKADAFFEKFDAEFDRLSKKSEAFKTSVDRGALTQLRREYFGAYKDRERTLGRIATRRRELSKKKHPTEDEIRLQSALDAWQDVLNFQQARFQDRVAEVIAPWTRVVQQALDRNANEVLTRAPYLAGDLTLANLEQIKDMTTALRDAERKQRDQAKQAARTLKTPEAQNELTQAQQAYDMAQRSLEDLIAVKPLMQDREILNTLADRLRNDLKFVFGTSSQLETVNPPLAQLAQTGYFTLDRERPADMQGPADPKTEGFNSAFMKLMARAGFDLGVSWLGFTDPMHFELVSGVEAIHDPESPKPSATPKTSVQRSVAKSAVGGEGATISSVVQRREISEELASAATLPPPSPTLPGLSKPEEQVLSWLEHHKAEIEAAEAKFHIDRRAIASAIAWEALKNPETHFGRLGRWALAPGKPHYSANRGPGEGEPITKEVEEMGIEPKRTMRQRKQFLEASPANSIEYIGAVMYAYADIAERNGYDIRCDPEILTNCYQGGGPQADYRVWVAHLKGKHGAKLVAGNAMALWTGAHLQYLETAVGTPDPGICVSSPVSVPAADISKLP